MLRPSLNLAWESLLTSRPKLTFRGMPASTQIRDGLQWREKGAPPDRASTKTSGPQKEQARKGAHFRFYFVDIGPTRKWGYPKQIKSNVLHKHLRRKVNAFDYQFTSLRVEQEPFDFYMVDGRYRVACALLSFLHGMQHGGDMDHVQVALHDRSYKGRGIIQLQPLPTESIGWN
jgi:hypothetical protein